MKIKDIQNLISFDDKLTDKWLDDVDVWKSGLSPFQYKKQRGYIAAGTGTGKTHFLNVKLIPHLIKNYDARFFIYVAPETMLVSKASKKKFMLLLETNNIIPREYFNESVKNCFDDLDLLTDNNWDTYKRPSYMTLTDSKFRDQIESLLLELKHKGLLEKTWIFIDEGAVGSVSAAEWYKDVYGTHNPEYKGKKYKMIGKCLKDIGGLMLFLPNETNEMLDDEIGTNDYTMINSFPTKDEMLYRTAHYNPTQWFDKETPAIDTISDVFNSTMSDQLKQDAMYHDLIKKGIALDTSEVNLNPKRGVIGKLETKYKNKIKNERDFIKSELKKANFPTHWDFKIAFIDGKSVDLYQLSNGSVISIETPKEYGDDDVVSDLRNHDNLLRVLFVTNKAGMGVDVTNFYDAFVLRIPVGLDNDGKPTILLGLNYLGRVMRAKITHEQLSPFFKDGQEKLYERYYAFVNGFTPWLPRSTYWESTIEKVHNTFNSVLRMITALRGDVDEN